LKNSTLIWYKRKAFNAMIITATTHDVILSHEEFAYCPIFNLLLVKIIRGTTAKLN
jgi:hypothetical protein